MLAVHGAGQSRVAVEQRGAVERRVQPLVRIDDERIRAFDAGEQRSRSTARGARRRRTRRRRASTGRVRRRSRAMPARSSTRPAFVLPAFATTAHTDAGSSQVASVAASASPVRRSSTSGTSSGSTSRRCIVLRTDECVSCGHREPQPAVRDRRRRRARCRARPRARRGSRPSRPARTCRPPTRACPRGRR